MLAKQQESQGEMGWQLGARCVSDSLTLVNAMHQRGVKGVGEINRVQVSLLCICYGFETSISQYATKKMRPPTKQLQGSCDRVAAYCSFVLIYIIHLLRRDTFVVRCL